MKNEYVDVVYDEAQQFLCCQSLMFNNGDFVAPHMSICSEFINGATKEIPIFTRQNSSPVKRTPSNGEEFILDHKYKKTYSNRDSLESLVLKRGYSFSREKNYFQLVTAIKEEIIATRLGKLFDSESYGEGNIHVEKQRLFFRSCGNRNGAGEFRIGTNHDGQDVSQSVVFKCGNRFCMSCRERERKRVLKKYLDYFSQFLRYTHCYRIQFTLPSEVSKIVLSNVVDEKIQDDEIINIVVKTVREMFGFKTRSNMPILVSRHIIGNTGGFFKNHLHYHVVCFPFEILTNKAEDGEKSFSLNYSKIIKEKAALDSSVICYCHDLFESHLNEKFEFKRVNTPHFSFIPKISGKKDIEKETKDKNAKIAHAVKYDARSFVNDFQKSFPCSEETGAYFYESDSNSNMKYVFRDIHAIVDRTIFVFNNSRYFPYGILTNMKRLESIFKYFEEESIIFNVRHSEGAIITRRYNAHAGKKHDRIKIDEYITLQGTGRRILIDEDMSSNLSFAQTLKKFGPVSIFEFYRRRIFSKYDVNLNDIVKVVDNIMYIFDKLKKKNCTIEITSNERALFRKFFHRSISFTRTIRASQLVSRQIPLDI